jgi:hypothetical protein
MSYPALSTSFFKFLPPVLAYCLAYLAFSLKKSLAFSDLPSNTSFARPAASEAVVDASSKNSLDYRAF